ncbi:MAG: hypothetical protein IPN29_08870 [Saprospiraceae bacterium]|nr:hypothetical protein [Saprospiraceae bacterium]
MKWYHYFFFSVNGIAALWLLYHAAMHLFVYFANRSLGHAESFRVPGLYLFGGIAFTALAVGGWYLSKNPAYGKIGLGLLMLPAIIVALYGLWAVFLLISSGGKWN